MPNILFIDPNPYVDGYRGVKKFKEALLQAGFQIEIHTSGGTAARIIDGMGDKLEEFDLIITEHFVLTPLNWTDEETSFGTRFGHAVVQRVHTVRPKVPIIILSVLRDDIEQERLNALKGQNVYFRRKQETSPEQLVALVHGVLATPAT